MGPPQLSKNFIATPLLKFVSVRKKAFTVYHFQKSTHFTFISINIYQDFTNVREF
jgi:hypothetical protein